jgi:hypothetical protein
MKPEVIFLDNKTVYIYIWLYSTIYNLIVAPGIAALNPGSHSIFLDNKPFKGFFSIT